MTAVAPDDSGLFSPEFLSNPCPFYTQLRAHDVLQTSFGFWLASRHKDVALLVRDRRFGKNFEANNVRKYGPRNDVECRGGQRFSEGIW
ncbi:MAG: cytochrome P450 [Gammaproteobacteria bacterium]|jgi:cytochrome P450